MVLDYTNIDFSGILQDASTMRKSDLVLCVESLVKELRNLNLEHARLDKGYEELLAYKNVLRDRLRYLFKHLA
jgi:hypothetical protein